MAGQQSAKGNPASHRMSNPRRKARRAECWARGQKRDTARKQAVKAAEERNAALLAEQQKMHGRTFSKSQTASYSDEFLTPWQRACKRRFLRREQKRQAA